MEVETTRCTSKILTVFVAGFVFGAIVMSWNIVLWNFFALVLLLALGTLFGMILARYLDDRYEDGYEDGYIDAAAEIQAYAAPG